MRYFKIWLNSFLLICLHMPAIASLSDSDKHQVDSVSVAARSVNDAPQILDVLKKEIGESKARAFIGIIQQNEQFSQAAFTRAKTEHRKLEESHKRHLSLASLCHIAFGQEFTYFKMPLCLDDIVLLQSLGLKNPYLTRLSLSKVKMEDVEFEPLSRLTGLRHLSIEENSVTDEGLRPITHLTGLTHLNVSKNKLTGRCIPVICRLTHLQELNLRRVSIDDSNLEGLACLPLSLLILRETGLGDDALSTLLVSARIPNLDLSYNRLTNEGAYSAVSNPHVKIADFRGNRVDPGLMRFLAAPNRAIYPSPRPFIRKRHKIVNILSIDGGGIRGIIPAYILSRLEPILISQEPKSTSRDNTFYHWAEHFDLMAGNSTGGIIVLGLNVPGTDGRPRLMCGGEKGLLKLYQQYGPRIFLKNPLYNLEKIFVAAYDPRTLEEQLAEYMGEEKLSSCCSEVMIPTYDLRQGKPYVFKRSRALDNLFTHPHTREFHHEDFLIKDVARATSAGPTYFEPCEIKNIAGESFCFIDGGVYANNPAFLALQEALLRFPDAKKFRVISLGTGETLPHRRFKELNNSGLLKWAEPVISILMRNAAEQTEEYLETQARIDRRIKYIRIQALLHKEEEDMDNASESNVEHLINAAITTYNNNQPKIEKIKKWLNPKVP